MTEFAYRVTTASQATIRETWTIRSGAPLTPAVIDRLVRRADLMSALMTPALAAAVGIEVTCDEDVTRVDEGDRIVMAITDVTAADDGDRIVSAIRGAGADLRIVIDRGKAADAD